MAGMESILNEKKECYFCRTTQNLEKHHIFRGCRRQTADRLGLWVWLCHEHHTGASGVHNNTNLFRTLQKLAQVKFEQEHTRLEWMQEIGKNYID